MMSSERVLYPSPRGAEKGRPLPDHEEAPGDSEAVSGITGTGASAGPNASSLSEVEARTNAAPMIKAAPYHWVPFNLSPRKIAASSSVPRGSKVLRTEATWGPTRFSPTTNSTNPNTVADRTIPRTAPHAAAPLGTRSPSPRSMLMAPKVNADAVTM